MGFSFKVGPGVKIRASSRELAGMTSARPRTSCSR
jgi:hypothetical protein